MKVRLTETSLIEKIVELLAALPDQTKVMKTPFEDLYVYEKHGHFRSESIFSIRIVSKKEDRFVLIRVLKERYNEYAKQLGKTIEGLKEKVIVEIA